MTELDSSAQNSISLVDHEGLKNGIILAFYPRGSLQSQNQYFVLILIPSLRAPLIIVDFPCIESWAKLVSGRKCWLSGAAPLRRGSFHPLCNLWLCPHTSFTFDGFPEDLLKKCSTCFLSAFGFRTCSAHPPHPPLPLPLQQKFGQTRGGHSTIKSNMDFIQLFGNVWVLQPDKIKLKVVYLGKPFFKKIIFCLFVSWVSCSEFKESAFGIFLAQINPYFRPAPNPVGLSSGLPLIPNFLIGNSESTFSSFDLCLLIISSKPYFASHFI